MLGRVVKIFAKNTTRTNKWIPIKKEAWRFFAKPKGLELDNPIGLNVWHSPTFALFFIIRNVNLVVNFICVFAFEFIYCRSTTGYGAYSKRWKIGCK